MDLKFPAAELQKLHAHAQEGYPYEVVGILAGERQHHQIHKVVPLRNERADSPQNRYVVSGFVLSKTEQALEAAGLEILGYYHSHPDHPAKYSDFDRDHALPNMSYVIVSVYNGSISETCAWRLQEDRSAMDAETLLLEE